MEILHILLRNYCSIDFNFIRISKSYLAGNLIRNKRIFSWLKLESENFYDWNWKLFFKITVSSRVLMGENDSSLETWNVTKEEKDVNVTGLQNAIFLSENLADA